MDALPLRNRFVFTVLALVVGSTGPAFAAPAQGPPGAVAAPHFRLPTFTGVAVDSDSLRGEVILVDFWASWCAPCERSFPWLTALDTQYRTKGLRIVAINLDKKRDAAEKFLGRHEVPFVVAFDPEAVSAKAFQVPGMPTTFLIDGAGNILYSHVGFDPGKTEELESKIEEACR